MPDKREGPRPLYEPTRHKGSQSSAVAQLHCDVHCIGNHTNIVPISQTAGDVSRSGAGRKSDSFIFQDQFRCGQPYASFVCCAMLLAVLKQGDRNMLKRIRGSTN